MQGTTVLVALVACALLQGSNALNCHSTPDYTADDNAVSTSCGTDEYCAVDMIIGDVTPAGVYVAGMVDFGCSSAMISDVCATQNLPDGICFEFDNTHITADGTFYNMKSKGMCCKSDDCNTQEALIACDPAAWEGGDGGDDDDENPFPACTNECPTTPTTCGEAKEMLAGCASSCTASEASLIAVTMQQMMGGMSDFDYQCSYEITTEAGVAVSLEGLTAAYDYAVALESESYDFPTGTCAGTCSAPASCEELEGFFEDGCASGCYLGEDGLYSADTVLIYMLWTPELSFMADGTCANEIMEHLAHDDHAGHDHGDHDGSAVVDAATGDSGAAVATAAGALLASAAFALL